jgi:hypothetical protein
MIVRTYRELEEYFRMFKKQNCELLIVMSKAGYGKTTSLKRVMKDEDFVYINTHSTPLSTYLTLWQRRDCPVVFDDLDAIFNSNIMVSMLKALTDTSQIKELNYATTSKIIGDAPQTFKTTSNVCILLNEFDIHNRTLLPIIDRAIYIEFQPSKDEILKKIKEIAKSQSIAENQECVYEFIEQNYKKVNDLSLRTYKKAMQLFIDNPDKWKERFMALIGFDEKVIQYLTLKDRYKTDNERIANFNWSRATYFRVKQEVEGD